MTQKVSIYDLIQILKSQGFVEASDPLEKALKGNNTVLIFASTAAAANMCQRSIYKRLGNKKIDFAATKWKFRFKNAGKIEIYTPSINPNNFHELNRETTFYSLYRD